MNSAALTSVFVGSDSLLIECAETWRAKGHNIAAVVTDTPRVTAWARAAGLEVLSANDDFAAALSGKSFDYLFAITYLRIIPKAVLALPKRGAINFHDGPLPRYAGLNAPTWALINREREYGISWHFMTAEIDAGDLLKQVTFPINADETSLSLNTRCFAVAIESYGTLVDELASGTSTPTAQIKDGHSYFGRYARPAAASVIDWAAPAPSIAALVRALDFGPRYPNMLGSAMFSAGGKPLLVSSSEALPDESGEAPGSIVAVEADSFSVACGEGTLQIRTVRELSGGELPIGLVLTRLGVQVGSKLDSLSPEAREQLTQLDQALARGEGFWTKRLLALDPEEFPYASAPSKQPEEAGASQRELRLSIPQPFSSAFPGESALASAFALYVARLNGHDQLSLALADKVLIDEQAAFLQLVSPVVPVQISSQPEDRFRDVVARFDEELAALRKRKSFLRNVGARYPELSGTAVMQDQALLPIGLALAAEQPAGTILQLRLAEGGAQLRYAAGRISEQSAVRIARELGDFMNNLAAAGETPVQQVELLSKAARERSQVTWNDTARALPENACIHTLIEAQVDRTPDAVAVACEDKSITYRQLDDAANRLANHLRTLGVKPDQPVGVHVERSIELVIATLGVLKAGGAYVPLDPAYPVDRVALMIEDSGLKVVVTQSSLLAGVSSSGVQTVALDAQAEALGKLNAARPAPAAKPENLAYIIYTSGSHRQAQGRDDRAPQRRELLRRHGRPRAVTTSPARGWPSPACRSTSRCSSCSGRCTHGFKVVVHTDEGARRGRKSRYARSGDKPLDFSLFYFSADANAEGSERYRLLLDGARYADEHGFSAVWTPERHFHAFGGLYPNPAVTGAAVAAITEKRRDPRRQRGAAAAPSGARGRGVVGGRQHLQGPRRHLVRRRAGSRTTSSSCRENYEDAKSVMLRDIEVVQQAVARREAAPSPAPRRDVDRQHPAAPGAERAAGLGHLAGNAETFEMAGRSGRQCADPPARPVGRGARRQDRRLPQGARERRLDPGDGIVSADAAHLRRPRRRDIARELVRGPLIELPRHLAGPDQRQAPGSSPPSSGPRA